MISGFGGVSLYKNTKSVGEFLPYYFYVAPDPTIATNATSSNTTASSFRSGNDISAFFSTSYNIFATTKVGEYLQVYFPAYTNVTTATYRNAIGSNWAPTSVKIQSSLDGVTWVDEAIYSDNASTSTQTISVNTETLARYWRFYQNSNTRQNTSGYEWHFGNFTMSGLAIPTSENDKYGVNPYNPIVINPDFKTKYYSNGFAIDYSSLVLALDAGLRSSYPGFGNTWFDLSEEETDATLNDFIFDSSNEGSIVFTGVNGSGAQLPGSSLSLSNLTISSWNYSANYAHNGFMFEKTTNGTVNTQYSLFFNSNDIIYFRIETLSVRDLTAPTSSSGVVNNQWNNVVATYDGSTKRIYVNGSLVASGSVTGTPVVNSTGPAYVGTYGNFAGYPFNGKISQTTVYSRSLTQQEVVDNFNLIKGRYGL